MTLTHGSLFSGIGGFDLGFERAGIKTLWQVEIDPFCRKVLAKHFPDAQRYEDIRGCMCLPKVDIISGGFPCQDISNAGKREGIDGERSGLWRQMRRVIRQVRPRYVIVENVAALLGRGIERVLGDLAESGFDAEWDVLPACAFGAPHIRQRVFILAYSEKQSVRSGLCADEPGRIGRRRSGDGGSSNDVAHRERSPSISDSGIQGLPESEQETVFRERRRQEGRAVAERDWWAVEPDVGRVAHGVPSRVDRLKGLGNALLPQIAEWIGRRIVAIS
jgi:DNA (cytosine-5)-methyltransferase 1